MLQYYPVKRIIAIFLLFIFLGPGVAMAQDTGISEERLQEIQDKRNVTLSEQTKTRVEETCAANRIKLQTMQRDSDQSVRKRLVLFGDIQKELKALELRITRQGADASELDLLIGNITQQLDNFRELNLIHDNLVSDLNTIDCKAKPELYVAGIEELREVRKRLLDQARSLKRTVIESPNTTFLPLIERLLI